MSLSTSRLAVGLTLAWVGAVVGVMLVGAARDAEPGAVGVVPERWPTATRLARPPRALTLVVALHPACPCTQASLDELEAVVTQASGTVATIVLVVRPIGLEDPSDERAAIARVQRIPGAVALLDPGGAEAERFGALTSGHIVVFDTDGRRVYSGGITAGRGQRGPGPARDAVATALGVAALQSSCPTYGCPLEGRSDE